MCWGSMTCFADPDPRIVPLTNGSGSLYPSQHLYEKREGSGSGARSGSIPLTNESGSRRPKNIQIRRLRIPNTGCYYSLWDAPGHCHLHLCPPPPFGSPSPLDCPPSRILFSWMKELYRYQSLNVVFTGVFVWCCVAIL